MSLLARAAAALVALALAAAALLWYAVCADRSHPRAARDVIVARGASFEAVAAQLRSDGVIGNALTFRLLAKLRGEEAAVRAGAYRFAPHQTQREVLHRLVAGGAQIAVWVTIPEGFTAEQIAARLHAAGLGPAPAFERTFSNGRLVVDGARTRSLEGFLFPSTYLVPLGETPGQVAALFTGEFFKELPSNAAARARELHVTVPQAVTVASLVEREAKREIDRPKIAAVIYNRLRLGMPLQVDATIEYALRRHKAALSFADLRIVSPYNTYAHAGLPPTPIANPGLPSLLAALHPARSDDLYYVYCGHGRHAFATTLAQHQTNVARCLQ